MKTIVYTDGLSNTIETPLSTFGGPTGKWDAIFIKDETKQRTGAFKIRGVSHFFSKRKPRRTVVAASTGNHGLAVATCARWYQVPAIIFVPAHTHAVKIKKLKAAGAEVRFVDGAFDQCLTQAKDLAWKADYTFIHSFEEKEIIDGHSSMFSEVDATEARFSTIFVPVGGGGLLTSCLNHYDQSGLKIIGVEYEGAPALFYSLRESHLVSIARLSGKAEGLLVQKIGIAAYQKAKASDVEIVLVSEEEMKTSMGLLKQYNQINTEYAGAASLAAALKYSKGQGNVLVIASGGNYCENTY